MLNRPLDGRLILFYFFVTYLCVMSAKVSVGYSTPVAVRRLTTGQIDSSSPESHYMHTSCLGAPIKQLYQGCFLVEFMYILF